MDLWMRREREWDTRHVVIREHHQKALHKVLHLYLISIAQTRERELNHLPVHKGHDYIGWTANLILNDGIQQFPTEEGTVHR